MEFHDGKCERRNDDNSACGCEQRCKNHSDFIRLWTAAGPAQNYNKKAWLDVERQLYAADVI